MANRVLVSGFLLGLLVLSGCATTTWQPRFLVNVDSISGADAEKRAYILLPGNKDTSAEDLQFKEYATYVNRALAKQGFTPAKSFEEANIAIFLSYGIGDPQEHQYSYSLPVWGQTGVSSATTYGTISSHGSSGSYSGTTRYTPTYGIKGYTSHTGAYITYFRFMLLDAVDLEEYKNTKT